MILLMVPKIATLIYQQIVSKLSCSRLNTKYLHIWVREIKASQCHLILLFFSAFIGLIFEYPFNQDATSDD